MSMSTLQRDAAIVAQAARRISSAVDYDALIERAGEAQLVLVGEASHGTHEFYATRAELTKRLIDEKGFRAVALEADWPDSFRVHRFVTGRSEDASAAEALSDFQCFPAWMWRNTVVVDFIEWLRAWNGRAGGEKDLAGIYGLDLYSMHTSIESVLGYLDKTDPHEARRARHRYACFEHFSNPDPRRMWAGGKGGTSTRTNILACSTFNPLRPTPGCCGCSSVPLSTYLRIGQAAEKVPKGVPVATKGWEFA